MAKHDVHIIGSVPMANATEVFTQLSAAIGPYLRYLPDGETGPRLDWLPWLAPIFTDQGSFELSPEEFRVHPGATPFRRYQLKAGVDPKTVRFTKMPHSGFALESWREFKRLKDAGVIPKEVRYQCDIASIPSLLAAFLVEPLHGDLADALEAAGHAVLTQEPELALEYLNEAQRRFTDLTPPDMRKTVEIERGRRLVAGGQSAEGLQVLNAVRAAHPFDPLVLYSLARQAGDLRDSLAAIAGNLSVEKARTALDDALNALRADRPRPVLEPDSSHGHGARRQTPRW